MSKSLKKLIDINRLREFKNKLVGTDSAYVQTGAVDQTVDGTKAFSEPIVGSVTGSSGSCTGNAATATRANSAASADTATNANYANSAGSATNATNATNAGYTNWLRTSSHADHLVHTEWDGTYFWTYVTAGDGGYRAVRVERSNSSGWADSAANANYANNAGPAGVIVPFAGTSVPTGYLLCNGAAVSRTDYANLFAAIGTLYGAGNGSTTFNLPDARDRVLQGASGTHSAGSYIAAGLPNITGQIFNGAAAFIYHTASGAFFVTGTQSQNYVPSGGAEFNYPILYFNAQRFNALYGTSNTVQSPAIATNFIIKY